MLTPVDYAGSSESSHQIALFMWANMARHYGFVVADDMGSYKLNRAGLAQNEYAGVSSLRWLHAIPNGGLRGKATAGKMKAEGVKSGVLDVFWPLRRGVFSGLYIEMKRPGKLADTSPEQDAFSLFVQQEGFCAVVFDYWRDAADMIKSYYRCEV